MQTFSPQLMGLGHGYLTVRSANIHPGSRFAVNASDNFAVSLEGLRELGRWCQLQAEQIEADEKAAEIAEKKRIAAEKKAAKAAEKKDAE